MTRITLLLAAFLLIASSASAQVGQGGVSASPASLAIFAGQSVYYVTNYGAIGDNSTPNDVVLNNLFTNYPNSTYVFGCGIFRIAAPLTALTNSSNLVGNGPCTTILATYAAGSTSSGGITLSSGTPTTTQIKNVTLSNFTLTRLADTSTTGVGLQMLSPGNVTLNAIDIYGFFINIEHSGGDTVHYNNVREEGNPATTSSEALFNGQCATTVLTVNSVTSGTLAVGQSIGGSTSISPGTLISSLGTGAGGTGTYNLSKTCTVSAQTMTSVAYVAGSTDLWIHSQASTTCGSTYCVPYSVFIDGMRDAAPCNSLAGTCNGQSPTLTQHVLIGAVDGLHVTNSYFGGALNNWEWQSDSNTVAYFSDINVSNTQFDGYAELSNNSMKFDFNGANPGATVSLASFDNDTFGINNGSGININLGGDYAFGNDTYSAFNSIALGNASSLAVSGGVATCLGGSFLLATTSSTVNRVSIGGGLVTNCASTGIPISIAKPTAGTPKITLSGINYSTSTTPWSIGSDLVSATLDITPHCFSATTTANAQIGTMPVNATIQSATMNETAGHTVSVGIGTTSGASDILAATSVTASTSTSIPITSFAKVWFGRSITQPVATQAIFAESASWGSASVNISVCYTELP